MAASYECFLFVALAATLCTVNLTNAIHLDGPNAGINLRLAFPSNAKPVNVTCTSGGFFSLRNTQNHTWAVPIDKVENCNAVWGHSSASFVAFDPQSSDIGHFVYWFAKFDGFFRSYDNLTWEKRASWIN